MEKTMAKMTTAIATELVKRIEALHDQINAAYREAGEYEGGAGNINTIKDIVKNRDEMRNLECISQGDLESFDLADEYP